MAMFDRPARALLVTLLSFALLVGGCSTADRPATSTATAAQESLPVATFCGDFTPPPYGALRPMAGVTVRVIDKAHFEVRNATDRTYYVAVFYWETIDNLVCGRGVTSRDSTIGPVNARSTLTVDGGSSAAIPATVSVWDAPCGESCDRPPIGEYLVPLSNVEPPAPVQS